MPLLKNSQKIINYLKNDAGYNVKKNESIESIGATCCIYLVVTLFNDKKLFIKAGEKVDLDIRNISYLNRQGINSILPLLKGTNRSKKILVNDFMPEPKAGYEMVEGLHNKKISVRRFLDFQQNSFNVLAKIYDIPVGKKEIYKSSTFLEKTSYSLKKICTEKNIFFINDGSRIYLYKILGTPITYIKDGQKIELPSIIDMFNDLRNKVNLMPIIREGVVHGDFHAPNIVKTSDNKIKIVDISDVHYREDPCWDLGKWLNYVKRFYRVATLRSNKKIDDKIKLSCSADRTIINDSYVPAIKIKKIHNNGIKIFSKMISFKNKNLVELRSAAVEVMVNIYTLRRHAKKYPNTVKSILSCICDSYVQYIKILK